MYSLPSATSTRSLNDGSPWCPTDAFQSAVFLFVAHTLSIQRLSLWAHARFAASPTHQYATCFAQIRAYCQAAFLRLLHALDALRLLSIKHTLGVRARFPAGGFPLTVFLQSLHTLNTRRFSSSSNTRFVCGGPSPVFEHAPLTFLVRLRRSGFHCQLAHACHQAVVSFRSDTCSLDRGSPRC
jgi:hypothetical protein